MNWYVLYTKLRSEKKVEQELLSLGINAYCPTRSEIRLWSDRKKRIEIPLLPSMVLVNLSDEHINKVFESSLVVRYMFWLGERATVRQSEIDILAQTMIFSSRMEDRLRISHSVFHTSNNPRAKGRPEQKFR